MTDQETYRPLPKCLTIKESETHGLGLFATEKIPKGRVLGKTHFQKGGFIIRTPLGGFYNHSDNPNCEKFEVPFDKTFLKDAFDKIYKLRTLRDIEPGEEIIVSYTFYEIDNG